MEPCSPRSGSGSPPANGGCERKRIPLRGATIVVGLFPYEEGSGGQARAFATW
jgi:hypothetical protein